MYWSWGRGLTKNVAVEASIIKTVGVGLAVSLHVYGGNRDHKGVYFSLELFKIYIEINVYDIRHKEEN